MQRNSFLLCLLFGLCLDWGHHWVQASLFPGGDRFYNGPSNIIGSSLCPIQTCTSVTPACQPHQWRQGCVFNSSGTCSACTLPVRSSHQFYNNPSPITSNNCALSSCPSCTAGQRNEGCNATSAGSCVACSTGPPAGRYFIAPPNAASQCVTEAFPVAPAGSRYIGQNTTFMGTLTQCSQIAEHLYFTTPVSHTENCVTAAKTICPAGQRNVDSNSTFQGRCVPCTGQVNGTFWINNMAWNSSCPSSPCSDASCNIGQWVSGCAGTNNGTCVACNTANATQVYSTRGGWANLCQVATCERVCPRGEYIVGCGVHGATSGSLTCAPCTNSVTNVNFYLGQGTYTPTSCPVSPCAACPNGNFRAGCGGLHEGMCNACTNT